MLKMSSCLCERSSALHDVIFQLAQKAYHWDDVYSAVSEICVHAPPRILSWIVFDLFSALLALHAKLSFSMSHTEKKLGLAHKAMLF